MKKSFICIIGTLLMISVAFAGTGIGIGITKTLNGNESFYQGNLFSLWEIFGLNLRITDFKSDSGEAYLFTPYVELALSSSKEFTTVYGGISPIISYENNKIGFDNLYFVNIGLKITLAIFSVYVEANYLSEINFEDKVIQFSDTPMVSIGGMLYIR
jgi:hypothetical protein